MSEEDEAADCKENGQKGKSKVHQLDLFKGKHFGKSVYFFFFFLTLRNPKSNLPKSCQTSSSTARASTSTASSTPETARPFTRCRPLRRVKLSAWLTLQVGNPVTQIIINDDSPQPLECVQVQFLMLACSYRIHPPQYGQAQSDLPSGLQNRLIKLQPSPHVERGMPDRYHRCRNAAVSSV